LRSCREHTLDGTVLDEVTVAEPDCFVAQLSQQIVLVGGHQKNARSLSQFAEARERLAKKSSITDPYEYVRTGTLR
jgi:hypothetical protein